MTRQEEIRFVALRSLGNFLVLFSLYGVFATFGPAVSEQLKFALIQIRGVQFSVAQAANNQPSKTPAAPDQSVGFAQILAGNKEQVLVPKDPYFSIIIPKLGASSVIIPNVDPNNPEEYLPALKQGVAHAKGSSFPGISGSTYLFAHSADNWWDIEHYNAVFYTLNNLSDNDEIVVFFENRRYNYFVKKKVIADPNDVSYLTENYSGPNRLVLQTCWPPGTTLQRLFVIAELKGN